MNGTNKKVKFLFTKSPRIYLEQIGWDQPINNFCHKIENSTTEAQELKDKLKERFPEVFSAGLWKCPKAIARFKLKENALPVFKKKRNVPFAPVEKIDKELDRLEKAGILSPVNGLHPQYTSERSPNEIRICADFSTGLNAVLKDYLCPLPTPEEVFNKLNGGVVFSKVDLSDAYLQIPVEEECSKLMCINNHRGLYKFERLAFGVKVAPAIFQQVIDTILGCFDFACAYLDNIVIAIKSTEEHCRQIHEVFERIHNFGFRIK